MLSGVGIYIHANMEKDYYITLGVPRNAAQEEIKQAFRTLAHQYHPDKPGGSEEQFKEINEAYQILGDVQKRATYDQSGASVFSDKGFGGTDLTWEEFKQHAEQKPKATSSSLQDMQDTAMDKAIDTGLGLMDDVMHELFE